MLMQDASTVMLAILREGVESAVRSPDTMFALVEAHNRLVSAHGHSGVLALVANLIAMTVELIRQYAAVTEQSQSAVLDVIVLGPHPGTSAS